MPSSSVLVINSGPSSIEYQPIDPETDDAIAKGLVERIGDSIGVTKRAHGDATTEEELPVPNHTIGMHEVPHLFNTGGPALAKAGIAAVGHRVVQDGRHFDSPVLIINEIHDLVGELYLLAPLHNPAHLKGISVAREFIPDIPHVAVFGTAFSQQLPARPVLYALETETAEKYSMRHYGAHGTSHRLVSHEIAKLEGHGDLKRIVVYLGNGASMSTVKNGHPIDTSMGLTPPEGLMTGIRTGDIDPAIMFHLQRVAGMSVNEVDILFSKEFGMKGMTGESGMCSVWEMTYNDDALEIQQCARITIGVHINHLLKYVGSYTAELGSLDVITLTTGIGKNDSGMRYKLTEALAPFGIEIDIEANKVRSDEPCVISAPNSTTRIYVFPTSGELVTAHQVPTFVWSLRVDETGVPTWDLGLGCILGK